MRLSTLCFSVLSISSVFTETVVYRQIDPKTGVPEEVKFIEQLKEFYVCLQVITKNECWQFTWDGSYNPADETKSCADFFPQDVCFPPLVYTNGENPMNGPDLGQAQKSGLLELTSVQGS